ncbi:putative uncharacterized protein DDB_G0285119, partial [Musca vetustissima]|uniref:putative uncharacterized protein DDB_G0285119 n=1 Tax=Musca vetustissima TaxID=27455 RepID=UPI002AB6D218
MKISEEIHILDDIKKEPNYEEDENPGEYRICDSQPENYHYSQEDETHPFNGVHQMIISQYQNPSNMLPCQPLNPEFPITTEEGEISSREFSKSDIQFIQNVYNPNSEVQNNFANNLSILNVQSLISHEFPRLQETPSKFPSKAPKPMPAEFDKACGTTVKDMLKYIREGGKSGAIKGNQNLQRSTDKKRDQNVNEPPEVPSKSLRKNPSPNHTENGELNFPIFPNQFENNVPQINGFGGTQHPFAVNESPLLTWSQLLATNLMPICIAPNNKPPPITNGTWLPLPTQNTTERDLKSQITPPQSPKNLGFLLPFNSHQHHHHHQGGNCETFSQRSSATTTTTTIGHTSNSPTTLSQPSREVINSINLTNIGHSTDLEKSADKIMTKPQTIHHTSSPPKPPKAQMDQNNGTATDAATDFAETGGDLREQQKLLATSVWHTKCIKQSGMSEVENLRKSLTQSENNSNNNNHTKADIRATNISMEAKYPPPPSVAKQKKVNTNKAQMKVKEILKKKQHPLHMMGTPTPPQLHPSTPFTSSSSCTSSSSFYGEQSLFVHNILERDRLIREHQLRQHLLDSSSNSNNNSIIPTTTNTETILTPTMNGCSRGGGSMDNYNNSRVSYLLLQQQQQQQHLHQHHHNPHHYHYNHQQKQQQPLRAQQAPNFYIRQRGNIGNSTNVHDDVLQGLDRTEGEDAEENILQENKETKENDEEEENENGIVNNTKYHDDDMVVGQQNSAPVKKMEASGDSITVVNPTNWYGDDDDVDCVDDISCQQRRANGKETQKEFCKPTKEEKEDEKETLDEQNSVLNLHNDEQQGHFSMSSTKSINSSSPVGEEASEVAGITSPNNEVIDGNNSISQTSNVADRQNDTSLAVLTVRK